VDYQRGRGVAKAISPNFPAFVGFSKIDPFRR
jgi:hypothetical protein